MRSFLVIIASLLLLAKPAGAVPEAVSRTLRTFDFEERAVGNLEELPMNWVKLEGPGLPHYVNGGLATDAARSGRFSFKFVLNGGSLIYRNESMGIRVQPGAHYRAEVWVRTTVMRRARARLSAWFVDVDGRRAEASVRHVLAESTVRDDERWQRLAVELSADSPEQRAIVVELGLVQPEIYAAPALGSRTLHTQDIHGSAWFDDLSVVQVPRVQMSTDRPFNTFRRSEPMSLRVQVSDRFVDDLTGRLVITDAAGRPVFQQTQVLHDGRIVDFAPGVRVAMLALPELPPGWYRASLEISSRGRSVSDESLSMIRLADDAEQIAADARFGLDATAVPFASWRQLPELVRMVGAGRVKLSVWSERGDVETDAADAFERVIEKLYDFGIAPTACLSAIPPSLKQRLGGDDWEQLIRRPADLWRPRLAQLLSRHARRIDGWQLGNDALAPQFVDRPQLREVYRAMHAEFEQLLMRPNLAVPWSAWFELPEDAPSSINLVIPPEVLPEQLSLYLKDAAGVTTGRRVGISLRPISIERYGREVMLRDWAQRIALAAASDAQRIDLPLFAGDVALDHPQPDELLMVTRTAMMILSHARFDGRVPIAEGVEALLFNRDGRDVLVVWSRSSTTGVKSLSANIGLQPIAVDVWGNARPVLMVNGEARLEIGPLPIFLLDIDGRQARMRASVAVDNPLLESSFKPHVRKLRFANPYSTAISGNFRIAPPPGWSIVAQSNSFSLNPGEVFETTLQIEFPFNSYAGPREMGLQIRMQDGADTQFLVPVPLQLGLSDVGLQTIALHDGDEVIVQQMITNYGDKPINYTAFALYPGQARQERLVTDLAPGRTTIKKYRFRATSDASVRVRSGLRELEGLRVLNEEVEIQ